jgi:hypothetical protein
MIIVLVDAFLADLLVLDLWLQVLALCSIIILKKWLNEFLAFFGFPKKSVVTIFWVRCFDIILKLIHNILELYVLFFFFLVKTSISNYSFGTNHQLLKYVLDPKVLF